MRKNKKFIFHEIKKNTFQELVISLNLDASNNIIIPEMAMLSNISKDFYWIVEEQQKRIDELTNKLNKVIKFIS